MKYCLISRSFNNGPFQLIWFSFLSSRPYLVPLELWALVHDAIRRHKDVTVVEKAEVDKNRRQIAAERHQLHDKCDTLPNTSVTGIPNCRERGDKRNWRLDDRWYVFVMFYDANALKALWTHNSCWIGRLFSGFEGAPWGVALFNWYKENRP